MRRVSIVGCSGSGKSTLGRALADRLGCEHVELDGIFHQPNWTQLDGDEFRTRVGRIAARSAWVIDGNYGTVVRDGPVWQRADTVIWIDLPRHVVMRRVVMRTLRRVVRREELWNGNRERPTNLLRWDPEESIIRWAWTSYGRVRERYRELLLTQDTTFDVVHLRSGPAIDRWLAGVPPTGDETTVP